LSCKYRYEGNKCKAINSICPFVYYCGKINGYKELERAKSGCKYMNEVEIPDGYKKVEYERHGYLYVNLGDFVLKVENPFDDIPQFVKVIKTKTGYKLKK
jgi:hypothetical protein